MLLVGTDSCEGQDVAPLPALRHADDAPGEHNDVTMLVHISDAPPPYHGGLVPGRLLVSIPACPDGNGGCYSAMSSQTINASYMYGGLPAPC